ncbi:MAG: endonuclease domain-containing protein [Prolixibacteraceae bacterium]|nr:endonuclease domain-containing protein [Prolixibacteraceae bacterium]
MGELDKNMYYGATAITLKKAKKLRLNMTNAEKLLWEKLNRKQLLELRFRRQHPINIYIVDFYCHEYKLVVELDGGIHKSQKDYDKSRSEDLGMFGLKVIRFKNSEVENDIDEVILKIKNSILNLGTEKSPHGGI